MTTASKEAVATVLARQDDMIVPNLGHLLDADALLKVFDIHYKGDTIPTCLACGKPAIGNCDATSSIHHRTQ